MSWNEWLSLHRFDLVAIPLSAVCGFVVAFLVRRARAAGKEVTEVLMEKGICGIDWITNPEDRRVVQGVQLLRETLPRNQLDGMRDIIRWLEEVRQEIRERRNELLDYFLVRYEEDAVVGVLYGHYYLRSKFFFISYLACRKSYYDWLGPPAAALLSALQQELKPGRSLRDCKGFVFELEHEEGIAATSLPAHEKERRVFEAAARKRLFRREARRRGLWARELHIPYYQPSLAIDRQGYFDERESLLFIDPQWAGDTAPRSMLRRQAEEIVNFVFDEIYKDSYEYDDPDEGVTEEKRLDYYKRLEAAKAELLRELPDPVELV